MQKIISLALSFILLLISQILIFDRFTLGGIATPFVFLVFLLLLPLSFNFAISISIGFFAGLFIDLFSHNYLAGLHAFSCVLMMALRVGWIKMITTRNSFKGDEDDFISSQSLYWYLIYFPVPVLIHHFAYFSLEAFSFSGFGITLLKILGSAIFTIALCLVFSIIFYIRPEKR